MIDCDTFVQPRPAVLQPFGSPKTSYYGCGLAERTGGNGARCRATNNGETESQMIPIDTMEAATFSAVALPYDRHNLHDSDGLDDFERLWT